MKNVALYILMLLCTGACNSNTTGIPGPTEHTLQDSTRSITKDPLSNDLLTKVYSQAIADFIKAVNKKHKTSFDTLFFGKHVYGQPDDFPDIELPGTIENTTIKLITPEIGQKKQEERKSAVYVNMVGWVNKVNAEFILVIFSNGGDHQYDCFVNYRYDPARKEFDLEKLRFEYFLYQDKQ